MKLGDINSVTATKLNENMKNRVGWNFDLNSMNQTQASAMLESVNSKLNRYKKSSRLHESQNDSSYGGLVLAKKVLETFIIEGAKPDFLDIDGDGNKKEPMKKAAADKKKKGAKKTESIEESKYGVYSKGGSVGEKSGSKPIKVYDTKEEAQAHAARLRKQRSPGEKKYYGVSYVVKPIKEKTNEAKKAVEPGAVATAQVKKMGKKYWTGKELTKMGIKKRDEIIRSIEKDQGKKSKVNESIESSKLYQRMRAIMENISDAESIMAAQDMVDRIQGMLEDVGEMLNEQLPPLVDSVRGTMDPTKAQQFNDASTAALSALLDAVREARTQMDNNVQALSGEGGAMPMTVPGAEPTDDEMDFDFDDQGVDDFETSDSAVGGDEPLGRAKRD